jgi:hypothetical protein
MKSVNLPTAPAADDGRAMTVVARFIVEDRAEAVRDLVPLGERATAILEREPEDRTETFERLPDWRRAFSVYGRLKATRASFSCSSDTFACAPAAMTTYCLPLDFTW